MPVQEFVFIEPELAWVPSGNAERAEQGFLARWASDGRDGRPSAAFGVMPEGYRYAPHFHDQPQFQVLLEGKVDFPTHKLDPISVHYSDPFTPYGPFFVGPDMKLGIFRPRRASITYMSDREARKQGNPRGRELYGIARDVSWSATGPEHPGQETKALITADGDNGPGAELRRCAPNVAITLPPATHGAIHVIVEGSASIEGTSLTAHATRYAIGTEAPRPIVAGPEGATILILTFGPVATTAQTAPAQDS